MFAYAICFLLVALFSLCLFAHSIRALSAGEVALGFTLLAAFVSGSAVCALISALAVYVDAMFVAAAAAAAASHVPEEPSLEPRALDEMLLEPSVSV